MNTASLSSSAIEKIALDAHTSSNGHSHPVIHLVTYSAEVLEKLNAIDLSELPNVFSGTEIAWIHVTGDPEVNGFLSAIASHFSLHPLVVADIGGCEQRAKVKQFEQYHFIVVNTFRLNRPLRSEQVSLLVGRNYVISFQNHGEATLAAIYERLQSKTDHLRYGDANYLAYTILSLIIDSYFPLLEVYGERLDKLEERVLWIDDQEAMVRIHKVKRDLREIRRTVWALRDVLHVLSVNGLPFSDETNLYLRDSYDHTLRIVDLVEVYQDLSSDLINLYLSNLSNRSNEIMKVLTAVATIFIPLTFITGVYGMNRYWGFEGALALSLIIGFGLAYFFYHLGWLNLKALKSQRYKSE